VVDAAVRHIGRAAGGTARVFLDGADAAPWPDERAVPDSLARLAAMWCHRHGEVAGAGTSHCGDADVVVVPLRSARPLGVAIVAPATDGVALPPPDAPVLLALGERAATALERAILVEQHETARIEVEGERLRTALLSSLSHDLRTPLASIEGAASSLLQGAPLSAEGRRELTETILEESRRMGRLVANLLDMIRVEAGTLAVRKEWQPLEECLGVALLRLEDRLVDHPVEVDLPPDLPLVPIDEVLIEQVLINLLENVPRHCPPGTPVTITAVQRAGEVVVTVADRGPGVPAGAEEAVFRKFFRGEPAGAAPGIDRIPGAGLGLTICRGIVTAHGGRMWVDPVEGGGAAFRFALPLEGPRLPAAPPDPEVPLASAARQEG
jgi:two-component system sensor histidine kinase KdpD